MIVVLATDRKLPLVHKVHNYKSGIGKCKAVSSVSFFVQICFFVGKMLDFFSSIAFYLRSVNLFPLSSV